MKERKTTVREFLRNYKKFSKTDVPVVIFNRNEPDGVFVPYEEWKTTTKKRVKKITIEEIEKFTFKSGIHNLSDPREIDKTCYDL